MAAWRHEFKKHWLHYFSFLEHCCSHWSGIRSSLHHLPRSWQDDETINAGFCISIFHVLLRSSRNDERALHISVNWLLIDLYACEGILIFGCNWMIYLGQISFIRLGVWMNSKGFTDLFYLSQQQSQSIPIFGETFIQGNW